MTETVVFYDGVCGLCDRFVQFVLTRDRRGRVKFATLQGPLASEVLPASGYDPADLDSILVIADRHSPNERVLSRSAAVLHTVGQLGGGWAVVVAAARIVPRIVADAVYAFVARRRYRVFGRFDTCPLPRPEWRDRFLS